MSIVTITFKAGVAPIAFNATVTTEKGNTIHVGGCKDRFLVAGKIILSNVFYDKELYARLKEGANWMIQSVIIDNEEVIDLAELQYPDAYILNLFTIDSGIRVVIAYRYYLDYTSQIDTHYKTQDI